MKRFSLILISVLSLSFLFGQKETEKPNPMKGVKTETKLKYGLTESFGVFKQTISGNTISKYGSNGNKIEELRYHSDGSLSYSITYKYDSNGNMVDESEYMESPYQKDGNLYRKFLYKYDSNGNKVEESKYNRYGVIESKSISKYDSTGNMVEQLRYDSDRSLERKYIYKYNDKNRLVEETYYSYEFKFGELQERLESKTTYKYVEY